MKFPSLAWPAALALSLATISVFAEGPLDPTFGQGYGFYPYLSSSGAGIISIARDSGGNLITAGFVTTAHQPGIVVTRHTPDGKLDSRFASAGVAKGFFSDSFSEATAVAVDHHNRIVVGAFLEGYSSCGAERPLAVLRLRNDGSPTDGESDLSFGTFGAALFGDCENVTSGTAGLAIDEEDGIVAVGSIEQSGKWSAALVRWTESGALDSSFGNHGAATTAYLGNNTFGTALAVDVKGRTWVAAASDGSEERIGLLMRYTADGSLDRTFGTDGFVVIHALGSGNICCITVDRQNRAVIAGYADVLKEDDSHLLTSFVRRYLESGSADASFGISGLVEPKEGDSWNANALALDSRDRPIVSGDVRFPYLKAAVLQFNLDGRLNSAVGLEGTYTTPIGFSNSVGTSIVLDNFGRPTITAMASNDDGTPVPVLIRYDALFGDGFD